MKRILTILLLLILCTLCSYRAVADCGDPPCEILRYYHVYDTEPDICAFEEGAGVFMRFDGAYTTGWYVVRASDLTSLPPEGLGFQTVRWYLFHDPVCGIVPW